MRAMKRRNGGKGGRRFVLRAALGASALLAVTAAGAADAAAQERASEDGWWEWALPDRVSGERCLPSRGRALVPGDARTGVQIRDHRSRAIDRRLQRDRRQWERGAQRQFRGGRRGHDVVWRRGLRDGIVFRQRPGHGLVAPHRRGGIVEEARVVELLGEAVLRQLLRDGGRATRSGPVTGRWLELVGGGAALQLRSGGVPLAELTDLEGDGRVDALWIAEILSW